MVQFWPRLEEGQKPGLPDSCSVAHVSNQSETPPWVFVRTGAPITNLALIGHLAGSLSRTGQRRNELDVLGQGSMGESCLITACPGDRKRTLRLSTWPPSPTVFCIIYGYTKATVWPRRGLHPAGTRIRTQAPLLKLLGPT